MSESVTCLACRPSRSALELGSIWRLSKDKQAYMAPRLIPVDFDGSVKNVSAQTVKVSHIN